MKPNVFVSPLDDSIVIKHNGKMLVMTGEGVQRLGVNLYIELFEGIHSR